MTAQATPTTNGKAPPKGLPNVTSATKALPNRVAVHATQKWGKTSFAAYAPDPIFICTRGEDGLDTLIKSGQLPETPHFRETAKTWHELLGYLAQLQQSEHSHRTLVIDTLNGGGDLCVDHTINIHFGGDPEKFDSYGRGMKPGFAPSEFKKLLVACDVLREQRNMSIIFLLHSMVKTFNNPEGPNYDRWEPVLPKEFWALTDRWVDMVLFGNFETHTEKANKSATKGKATGGNTRIIHTERTAAFDAGNRLGLPPEIECGKSAKEAWSNFVNALHPQRNGK